jgi:hypothetical protein
MHEANTAAMSYDCTSGGNEDSVGCHVPYREAVGCLTHLMMATHPDITFAMSPAA